MIERYRHTQIGYLIIVSMVIIIVPLGITLAITGMNWFAIGLVGAAVGLVLFYSLTVVIREHEVEVRFGLGLIKKRFKLSEIESCQIVRNHWYDGWGIHLTSHGVLYNVSGLNAVEIKLRTDQKCRIGTDVPQELQEAIQQAITYGL